MLCDGDLYCALTADVFAFLVTFRGSNEARSSAESIVIRSPRGEKRGIAIVLTGNQESFLVTA